MNPTLKIQKDLSHFKIGLILFLFPNDLRNQKKEITPELKLHHKKLSQYH